MLGYRLTVNCDTNGYLTWSLLFDSPIAKYGDTDTDKIFSVRVSLLQHSIGFWNRGIYLLTKSILRQSGKLLRISAYS